MTLYGSSARSLIAILRIVVMAMLAVAFGALSHGALGQPVANAPMKIGIVGSGNIGGTVGSLWVKAGHSVLFSSRHPEELKQFVERLGPSARAGTVQEALDFGDAIFIAVPYGAYPQIGRDFAREWSGRIVLDAGNAIASRDGEIANEARENGIGVTSAKYLTGARIVRAFNAMNYRKFASNANRSGVRMAIPLAGDDQEALAVAQTLVRDAGFDPVIIGGLDQAGLFAQGAPLYGQDITAQEMQLLLKKLQ